jgi:hypothetical protein
MLLKLSLNFLIILFLSGFHTVFSSHAFQNHMPLKMQRLILEYAEMPVILNSLGAHPIEALTFCPTHKYLAFVNNQHEIIICDTQTLAPVITIQAKKNSKPITQLDTVSKKLTYKAQGDFLVYGSFSDNPDHRFTILINLRKLSQSGKYTLQEYPRRNIEFSNALNFFAYNRDNTLSLNNDGASIQLHNRPFAYTPDSRYLCLGDIGEIEMRDAQTGAHVDTIMRTLQPIGSFAFSANSALCVTKSADTIIAWNLVDKTAEEVYRLAPDQVFHDIEHLSMSADGKTISFLHNTEIYIYDLVLKKIIMYFTIVAEKSKEIAVSPDNKYVATISPERTVAIWHMWNNQKSQQKEN